MDTLKLLAKNAVAHGLLVALGLIFMVAGARLMSIGDYGELRFVMAVLPLLMAFSLPGYDVVILRCAALRQRVALGRIFATRFVGGLCGAVVLSLFLFWLESDIPRTLFFFLGVTALFLPLYETGTGYRNYLLGHQMKKAGLSLSLRVRATALFLFLAYLGALYAFALSPLTLYPAYLVSLIVPTLIVFAFVALRQPAPNTAPKLSSPSVQFPAAVGATLSGAVATLSFSIDKIFVWHMLGAEALAYYAVLLMVPQELARFFDTTVPLFYRNLFFRQGPAPLRSLLSLAFVALITVSLYSALFYFLSARIFGPVYAYDGTLVCLSGLVIVSQSIEYWVAQRIFARMGASKLLVFSLANLLVTALLVRIGLQLDGLEGALLGFIGKQLLAPIAFFVLRPTAGAPATH